MESKIKASELRLGNFILDDEGRTVKVECIESKYFNYYDGGSDFPIKFSDKDMNFLMCDIDKCRGIELTEQVLLKCGFKKEKRSIFDIIFMTGNVAWYSDGINCVRLTKNGFWYGETKIQYLHKFQNLYYELESKELEFKA